jgi:hypothetical protein
VISDKVGMRIDAGLDRGKAGQTTTVTCISPAERKLLTHVFSSEGNSYERVGGFELASSGYLEEIEDE